MQIIQWIAQHPEMLAWVGGLSMISFFGTLAAVPCILLALPQDYLSENRRPRSAQWPRPSRWIYRILKNIIGAGLVLAGLAMLVLPGQGLLTILLGLVLMDVPGKHRVISRLLGRKGILPRINRLRQRFDRPSLTAPDHTL